MVPLSVIALVGVDRGWARWLRRLQREEASWPFVFTNSPGSPLIQATISTMIKRLGKGLFAFPIHAHMLRHACGYYLANRGVDTRTIRIT